MPAGNGIQPARGISPRPYAQVGEGYGGRGEGAGGLMPPQGHAGKEEGQQRRLASELIKSSTEGMMLSLIHISLQQHIPSRFSLPALASLPDFLSFSSPTARADRHRPAGLSFQPGDCISQDVYKRQPLIRSSSIFSRLSSLTQLMMEVSGVLIS